ARSRGIVPPSVPGGDDGRKAITDGSEELWTGKQATTKQMGPTVSCGQEQPMEKPSSSRDQARDLVLADDDRQEVVPQEDRTEIQVPVDRQDRVHADRGGLADGTDELGMKEKPDL